MQDDLYKNEWGKNMVYLIIFIAKIIEVTMATLRIVFISKGQRNIGAVVAVLEISIWVTLAGTVVVGITEDPLKMVAYVSGFVIGCYIGSWLEEKIALGITNLNIIATESVSEKVIEVFKSSGIAYTVLCAQGQKDDNKYIIAYIKRNRKKEIISKLKSLNEQFFMSMNDTSGVMGGYGLKRK